MTKSVRFLACSLVALVAGCASKPAPVAVAPAPVPVAVVAPSLPPGATPGMRIPVALADGSYPTPNRALSQAAALWHLRAGLNVAALSCPGTQGAAIVASYNALLARHKPALAAAETALSAEFRTSGAADWRDAYDDAMTRLYNYFSQTPARPAFCAAAATILAGEAGMVDADLATYAPAAIAELDRPFTDFYRAYDAWRQGQAATPPRPLPTTMPMIVIASAERVAPARTVQAVQAVPAAIPYLRPSIEPDTAVVAR